MTTRADLTIANGKRLAEIAKATGCAIEVKVGDRVIRIIPDVHQHGRRGIDSEAEDDPLGKWKESRNAGKAYGRS